MVPAYGIRASGGGRARRSFRSHVAGTIRGFTERPSLSAAEFEVVRVNKLARDTYWSTPVAAGGALFVCSVGSLYRIGGQ